MSAGGGVGSTLPPPLKAKELGHGRLCECETERCERQDQAPDQMSSHLLLLDSKSSDSIGMLSATRAQLAIGSLSCKWPPTSSERLLTFSGSPAVPPLREQSQIRSRRPANPPAQVVNGSTGSSSSRRVARPPGSSKQRCICESPSLRLFMVLGLYGARAASAQTPRRNPGICASRAAALMAEPAMDATARTLRSSRLRPLRSGLRRHQNLPFIRFCSGYRLSLPPPPCRPSRRSRTGLTCRADPARLRPRWDGAALRGLSIAKANWRVDADGIWAALGTTRERPLLNRGSGCRLRACVRWRQGVQEPLSQRRRQATRPEVRHSAARSAAALHTRA